MATQRIGRYAVVPAQRGVPERDGQGVRHAANTPWRPTAGIPVPLPKDLRTGHADHRIGCFRPDQRTVQQRHHHAEGHRNSRSIGDRRGFRQGTEESGAERSLVEKRRT